MQVSGYSNVNSMYSAQNSQRAGSPPPKPDAEEMFSSSDADGSGSISLDEATSFAKSMHEKMAANAPEGMEGQGPEFSEEKIQEAFESADADGNGELSTEEYKAMLESMRPEGGPGGPGGGMPPPDETDLASATDTTSTLLEMFNSSDDDDSSTSSYLSSLVQNAYGINSSSSSYTSTLSTSA